MTFCRASVSLLRDAEIIAMCARPSSKAMRPGIDLFGMSVNSWVAMASIAALCGSMSRRAKVVDP